MTVPEPSHAVWKDIVTGRIRPEFQFLAIRILLGRVQPIAQRDPSQVPKLALDLHALFVANAHLPGVQRDLAAITK